jgi:hypothetical protein
MLKQPAASRIVSRYLFILGAGASKHTGAPLMADFLDKSRGLFAANRVSEYTEDLSRVFNAISKLQSVHSKSELDIVNLESVFSAFEMAELLDLPLFGGDLVHSMRRLIAWTLDEAVRFEAKEGKIVSSPPYRNFASMIFGFAQGKGPPPTCTVITFNYDLAVDLALHTAGLNPNYGLAGDSEGAVNLFKLHGSVNWHRCKSCKRIVPETIPPLDRFVNTATLQWSKLKQILGVREECCGEALTGDSIIVPPSWNKAEYRSDLVKVWQHAAKELKGATSIVVCGYSLPETDSFFRYLYGLGTEGGEPLERFWYSTHPRRFTTGSAVCWGQVRGQDSKPSPYHSRRQWGI